MVCVINEELKEYAVKMGAEPEKVHVVRAGVDIKRFNPDLDGSKIRKKFGIGEDEIVLFFMGWLYNFSGLKEVAMELVKARNENPKIKLLIVGEGDVYYDLQQIKRDYGLEQLLLVGWQPYESIPEYLAASDIRLLPAHNNEVMKNIVPIKMYEYLACGKLVISTRLPGIIIEFGYNNGVIYVDHPSEVLEKVKEITRDAGFRQYGMKTGKFIEKYTWENITDNFEAFCKI